MGVILHHAMDDGRGFEVIAHKHAIELFLRDLLGGLLPERVSTDL